MRLLNGTLLLARRPLRLGLLIAERGFSGAAAVARIALEILDEPRAEPGAPRRPADRHPSNGRPPAPEVTVEPEVDVRAPEPGERGPEPEVVEPPTGEPPAPEPPMAEPPPAEPDHVDEEPVLVAEHAERGAEEGAGAEVHVDEPWEGYDSMTATEIRARLEDAEPEVVAAVKLYEVAGKDRSSVIDAADRRLRS